jgi:predicted DCC family thiol-disulfide oxidoreductase YuxK
MREREKPTVYYDGACPLCRREIAFYRKREGAEAVRWIDVNRCAEGEVAPGLSKEQALARFHLRDGSGNMVSGGRAFARLWQALPGLRFWGRLLARRPFVWLLDPAYDLFLKLRPRLQALAQRLEGAR